jgi:hydrogenase maturation protein HypF
LEVHGTVQGVGFRPYVYRLARSLGLHGTVANVGGHVVIEAAGTAAALDALLRRLPAEAPPHAVVTRVQVTAPPGRTVPDGFRVIESERTAPAGDRDVPPDLATCRQCLRELFDPTDRRFRYPFVNCTDCGPRATIIDSLPYDRPRTTMAGFPLCPACAAEYADPGDRRFHAEPVACPACGPRLAWHPAPGDPDRAAATGDATPPVALGEPALAAAVARIAAGGVVALKGLGGYQLVCDATKPAAVRRLRERKHRPAKPFAVMVADLARAAELADLGAAERALLISPARPIVLADALLGGPLAAALHPGTDQIGLFLPNTPLHHLLLHDLARPLVVTSGNRAGEPIAIDDADALTRLAAVADGFLRHDRPIRARYDDSVARVIGGRPALVRRARGYAPAPLRLPRAATRPVLAVGAQLKHTFALAHGERVVVSPQLGDLSDADTFDAFEQSLAHLSRLSGIVPELVAHDLHPGYLSTEYARSRADWPRMPVQHHHAHLASCAAEHGRTGRFIGVAYDGLGFGDDGTLWGGEILVADLTGYRRVGRFGRAPLPGGEAAIRRPARMALAYLLRPERLGRYRPTGARPEAVRRFTSRLPAREVEVVRRMLERGVNSPLASSAGRLFDAVASLLGLCDQVSYEGQAAVALAAAAAGTRPGGELPWRLVRDGGQHVYDPTPTVAAVVNRVAAGAPVGVLAAAFHETLVAVTIALCQQARLATGLDTVCLSGGVFQNRLLTERLRVGLAGDGFEVLTNQRVPTGDGGISYGQAAIAAARTGGIAAARTGGTTAVRTGGTTAVRTGGTTAVRTGG